MDEDEEETDEEEEDSDEWEMDQWQSVYGISQTVNSLHNWCVKQQLLWCFFNEIQDKLEI